MSPTARARHRIRLCRSLCLRSHCSRMFTECTQVRGACVHVFFVVACSVAANEGVASCRCGIVCGRSVFFAVIDGFGLMLNIVRASWVVHSKAKTLGIVSKAFLVKDAFFSSDRC